MQSRFVSTFFLFTGVTFAVVGGCGGDDETSKPAGGGGTTSGGSGGKGGTNGGGGDPSTSGGGEPSTSGGGEPGVGGGMGSPEPTGSFCEVAADCYAGLDTSELSGAVECIDSVEDGYCTHECEEDADCCAVEGECRTGFKQVCASFESSGTKYCFLSCEDEDLVAAGGAGGNGAVDANEYCAREANPRFGCRSTGGGVENRQVCLPDGGGAAGAGGGPGGPPPMGGAGGADTGAAGGANSSGAGGTPTGAAGANSSAGGASSAGAGGV